MSAIHLPHRRTPATGTDPVTPPASATYAWEVPHASPEDRALGLELELIELVQQRRSSVLADGEILALDRDIDGVLVELASIGDTVHAA